MWNLSLQDASAGKSGRACLAIQTSSHGRQIILLADSVTDECAMFEMPSDRLARLLALSYDGSTIALWAREGGHPQGHLIQVDLAASKQVATPVNSDGVMAAFAPDGGSIAAVHARGLFDDEATVVSIIDPRGAELHRLAVDGVSSLAENAVSWSSDGRLLAFDCHLDSGSSAVVVLNGSTGEVRGAFEGMALFASSNGVWIDDSRLIMVYEESDEEWPPIMILDIRTGQSTRLPHLDRRVGLVRAAVGETLLQTQDGSSGVQRLLMSDLFAESALIEIGSAQPGVPEFRMEFAPGPIADRFSAV